MVFNNCRAPIGRASSWDLSTLPLRESWMASRGLTRVKKNAIGPSVAVCECCSIVAPWTDSKIWMFN